jgi:hypothetical protein
MEQMTTPAKPWLWKPGQSGNVNGRPPGARQQFSEAFLRDLRDGWERHGRDVIDRVAKLEPVAFFATAARIIPKDVEISLQARSGTLDETDLTLLRAIRDGLPPDARTTPQMAFEHTLKALQLYDAKVIEAHTENPSKTDDEKPA